MIIIHGMTPPPPHVGRELTVIAWLWARTVKGPNPAFANVDAPLASIRGRVYLALTEGTQ
jgi:hypothetical protein